MTKPRNEIINIRAHPHEKRAWKKVSKKAKRLNQPVITHLLEASNRYKA